MSKICNMHLITIHVALVILLTHTFHGCVFAICICPSKSKQFSWRCLHPPPTLPASHHCPYPEWSLPVKHNTHFNQPRYNGGEGSTLNGYDPRPGLGSTSANPRHPGLFINCCGGEARLQAADASIAQPFSTAAVERRWQLIRHIKLFLLITWDTETQCGQ